MGSVSYLIVLLGFILFKLISYLWKEGNTEVQSYVPLYSRERKNDKVLAQMDEEPKGQNYNVIQVTMEPKGTRDLFLETLTKLGCQFEIEDDEDGDIHFGYQGEYFTVKARNDCQYVEIYDICWGHVELYDVDELSRLRKAINESNLRNSVIAVYTVDETGGNMNVHCKSIILFIPEIPNLENYLRMELNEYFLVHQFIGTEMARQRELEAKNA